MLSDPAHVRARSDVDCETDPFPAGLRASARPPVCSLCGARYRRAGEACSACPLHAGCALARCPHCGFSAPARSRWADWVGRVLGIPTEDRS